ncbi:MAG: hypothetical protein KAV42_00380 [Candidatus Krumholzibacteria bacterium]|nr:hypothetical protein [Candidatus Krumholzibacteria bacterium]
MKHFNSGNSIGILLLFAMTLLILLPACRDEREPLDRNRAPETFLTIAPPETTETDYKVHLYWHGEDKDGIVTRYMWFHSDTIRTLRPDLDQDVEFLDWNPEVRASDYVRGHFTHATDTVFIFEGYDNTTGALLNRQSFHLVAIDDMGKMDPTPSRIQFFAKVDCLPETFFWTSKDGNSWKPYVAGELDTMSMFTDVFIRFTGTTCNSMITGYQWIHSGKTYPDENNDGIPEWRIPPPDTMTVALENDPDSYLPSGDFYFKVIARDEAGARSRSDILTGEGVCQIVINYDPDTRVTYGDNYFTKQNGDTAIRTVDFNEGEIDTLPYKSRLKLHYLGWDDDRDILEFSDPPVPMRFQTMYGRIGVAQNGSISSHKTPWYPTDRAEDTNCYADEDSVTIRIGSYEYFVAVRSFDEQYRSDGTPDTVRFFGNYSPTIDDVQVGIDSNLFIPGLQFLPISGDTLYVNIATPLIPMGDTCNAYERTPDDEDNTFTYMFKYYLSCSGHDDQRDPPGSGVRSWWFSIDGVNEDYYYRNEDEWISNQENDVLLQECVFRIEVPYDLSYSYPWPDSLYVNDVPEWMGDQELLVRGKDIRSTDTFDEGMRCTSPTFSDDDPCEMVELGTWCIVRRYPANYARSDEYTKNFYIKLIYHVPAF